MFLQLSSTFIEYIYHIQTQDLHHCFILKIWETDYLKQTEIRIKVHIANL